MTMPLPDGMSKTEAIELLTQEIVGCNESLRGPEMSRTLHGLARRVRDGGFDFLLLDDDERLAIESCIRIVSDAKILAEYGEPATIVPLE